MALLQANRVYYAETAEEWAARVAPVWSAFSKLLQRPWWRRIWVVQEVVVAARVVVVCGSTSIGWSMLLRNLLFYERVLGYIGVENAPVPIFDRENPFVPTEINSISELRCHRQQETSHNIFQLLIDFRDCLSTDPRDKVFALLGLADSSIVYTGPTDYSLPVSDLYNRIAADIIQQTGNLNTFAYAWSPVKTEKVASWAPDWSQSTSRPQVFRQAWHVDKHVTFNACADSESEVTFSDGLHILRTKAYCFGSIDIKMPAYHNLTAGDLEGIETSFVSSPDYQQIYGGVEGARSAIRRTWHAGLLPANELKQFYDWLDSPDVPPAKIQPRKVTLLDFAGNMPTEHDEAMWRYYARGYKQWRSTIAKTSTARNETYDTETEEPPISKQVGDVNLEQDKVDDAEIKNDAERENGDEGVANAPHGELLIRVMTGRTHFFTTLRWMGLGPENMLVGDVLCVVPGAEVPWLVRPTAAEGEVYEFVGECYVEGIMYGQQLELCKSGKHPELCIRHISMV